MGRHGYTPGYPHDERPGSGPIRELQLRQVRRNIDVGWNSLESGEGIDGYDFFKCLEREEQELTPAGERA
jgi:hypothetical protein